MARISADRYLGNNRDVRNVSRADGWILMLTSTTYQRSGIHHATRIPRFRSNWPYFPSALATFNQDDGSFCSRFGLTGCDNNSCCDYELVAVPCYKKMYVEVYGFGLDIGA